MIFSAIVRYIKNKMMCYLDHARVALVFASAFFNSCNRRLSFKYFKISASTVMLFLHRAQYILCMVRIEDSVVERLAGVNSLSCQITLAMIIG
jgi:hypothetical protein